MAGGGEGDGAGRRRRGRLAAPAVSVAVLLSACGGGGDGRPNPVYTVSVPTARFPARQQIATPVALRVVVRNDGDRALPDVAVSIDSFGVPAAGAVPESPRRSVWIVDRAPGGPGSDPQTWALGSLAPGATRSFVWRVTPVVPGRYTVGYRVSAGPAGTAPAELAGGRPAGGILGVTVSGAPADARVDPATGRVIRRRPLAHIAP